MTNEILFIINKYHNKKILLIKFQFGVASIFKLSKQKMHLDFKINCFI
jgi:hypothetical protein